MAKNKIQPVKRLDLSKVEINQVIDIHADRLASFKATVSRFNKDRETLYRFKYSGVKNDYIEAVRVEDAKRKEPIS